MAFFTTDRLRRTAARSTRNARATLSAEAARIDRRGSFDVFLSHSFNDAELILGVKRELEALGKSVYVDWIDDPELDRNNVTVETATLLRVRLNASASLIYAATSNAAESRWMPWELGYFDGLRQDKVSVLPVIEPGDDVFRGSEFLFLYPLVEIANRIRDPIVCWRRNGEYTPLKRFASASRNLYRPL